jgi:hypothetical protein
MVEEDVFGEVESSSGFGDVVQGQVEVFWLVCKVRFVHVTRLFNYPWTTRKDDFGCW